MISVVIPTYNAEDSIERALLSVIDQSYRPIEIVVVDDGSSDNTQQVVEKVANDALYLNILYIFQENKGPSAARNLGASLTKGNYLAFLDADDQWHSNKLKIQMQLIKKNDLKFLGSTYQYGPFSDNCKETIASTYNFNDLLIRNRFSTPGVIIKKDFFEALGGFDENLIYAEDYDLWLRASLHGELTLIESPKLFRLYKHAFGDGGLSSHMFKMLSGERTVFKKLFKHNNISWLKYLSLYCFLTIKFVRRVLVRKYREKFL
jgi:glycosyltransferase involved in cell wall biosynthesis